MESDLKDRLNIEQRLSCLETLVDEIKNNHLKHIEMKIDRIQWLLVVTSIGLVANLLEKLI